MNPTLKPVTAHTAQSLAMQLRSMGKPKLAHEVSQIGYKIIELEAAVRYARKTMAEYLGEKSDLLKPLDTALGKKQEG